MREGEADSRLRILSLEDGSFAPFAAPAAEGTCKGWIRGTEEMICQRSWAGNLWVYGFHGEKPRQLTHFEEGLTLEYALSHDGKQLAYVRGRVRDDAVMIRDFR